MLGFRADDVVGKSFKIFFRGDLFDKIQQCVHLNYPAFKSEMLTSSGDTMKVFFHVLNEQTFLLYGSDHIRNAPSFYVSHAQRESKRTFAVLRYGLLHVLSCGKRMTINQIAHAAHINWKTVEKHLTYLIGKKLVEEVFSSEYVRIFEMTKQGLGELERFQREYGASRGG